MSCHQTDIKCLVSLGANLNSPVGTPRETLAEALRRLEGDSIRVTRTSRFYSTPCFPAGAGPDYVNAAAELTTTLPPEQLLEHLNRIEADLGRVRKHRWGGRGIDLDLLACGAEILPDEQTVKHWIDLLLKQQMIDAPETLILPHPRLQDRGFVLVPLADIAPDWRHPLLGQTVSQMLALLPAAETAEIRAL